MIEFFNNIDWTIIGKYIGLFLVSGISMNLVIGLILKLIPNPTVFSWCKKFGIFITKVCREKWSEENVDLFSTTLCTALNGVEAGIKEANPDIKDEEVK